MRKLLIILFLGIFLISLASSFDEYLPSCYGGDEELILCFGDNETIFIGDEVPAPGGGPGGAGVDHLTTPPEEIPEIPPIEPPSVILASILGMLGLEDLEVGFWDIMLILMFLCILFIFIFKNREKKKEIKKLKKQIKK